MNPALGCPTTGDSIPQRKTAARTSRSAVALQAQISNIARSTAPELATARPNVSPPPLESRGQRWGRSQPGGCSLDGQLTAADTAVSASSLHQIRCDILLNLMQRIPIWGNAMKSIVRLLSFVGELILSSPGHGVHALSGCRRHRSRSGWVRCVTLLVAAGYPGLPL